MALSVANGDIWNVRLFFDNAQTRSAMNILHYRVLNLSGTGPSSAIAGPLVAQIIYNKLAATWSNLASEQVNFRYVTATNVFPLPRSMGFSYVPSGGTPGLDIGDALPLQDTVTLLKRTVVSNRWGLGRLFFVGTPETQQSDGIVQPAYVTAMASFAALLDDVVTIAPGGAWSFDLEPVLVGGPESSPTRVTRVQSVALSNNVIKTQRRRRPGKGI